jgi:hypothetical protein
VGSKSKKQKKLGKARLDAQKVLSVVSEIATIIGVIATLYMCYKGL